MAVERELGNRQGRRTDLQLVEESPQVKGVKTRKVAATLAGFKNDFLYRQAKVVIKQGLPSLIHAMDNRLCSITQAEKIALLPKRQQHTALTNLLNQKNIHQIYFKEKENMQ